MEMPSKPDPIETPAATLPSPSPGVVAMPASPVRVLGIILRGFAVVFIFIATIVMGVAEQILNLEGMDDYGYPASFKLTIKSTDSSAYVYFIAANAIALFFSVVAFVVSVISPSSFSVMPALTVVDLVIVALLLSCNGAAAAVTVIAKSGIIKIAGEKLCDAAGKFCSEVTAAVVLSMIASLACFLLVLISAAGFHKRSQ